MNSSYDGTSISRRHIGKNIYTFTRHVGKLFLSYLPCSVRKEWQEIYPFHKSKHGYLLNLARLGIWWPIEPFLGIWLKLRNCYWNYTLKRANQGSDSHFGLESILGSTRYLSGQITLIEDEVHSFRAAFSSCEVILVLVGSSLFISEVISFTIMRWIFIRLGGFSEI